VPKGISARLRAWLLWGSDVETCLETLVRLFGCTGTTSWSPAGPLLRTKDARLRVESDCPRASLGSSLNDLLFDLGGSADADSVCV